jgi:hypothetical protein
VCITEAEVVERANGDLTAQIHGSRACLPREKDLVMVYDYTKTRHAVLALDSMESYRTILHGA